METEDPFLSLFPHRYDFIYADYPDPGRKPDWKTESRYPLSDRLVQQAEGLFGVRFGRQTHYCLLDIDITSAYHPQRDAFAISNLVAALEPLGLVSYIACISSSSNGIHLYFPFQQAQNSWEVGVAIATSLEKAGFKLAAGQLEIFPNLRPYVPGSRPGLFQAHRLPMQMGSYLLNQDFQPIWSDRSTFVRQWGFAQDRNVLNLKQFKHLVQIRQKFCQVSGKAEKFLADLNAELEAGWTGCGQTNHLLGRIALRTYVFHHVLFGGQPLAGQALIDQIVALARSLPGYREWCRHQHEIVERATEWARCVEGSRYFPYGSRRSVAANENGTIAEIIGGSIVTKVTEGMDLKSPESLLTWNQQQAESARDRIKQAIVHLLETDALPATTTARFRALTQCGVGGSSLYRHRDLWHPEYLMANDSVKNCSVENCSVGNSFVEQSQPVENPPDPPELNSAFNPMTSDSARGASDVPSFTSLFPAIGGNALPDQDSARSTKLLSTGGCNFSFPAFAADRTSQDQRMRQFFNSGDPILVAEATAFYQRSASQKLGKPKAIEPQHHLVCLDSELNRCNRHPHLTATNLERCLREDRKPTGNWIDCADLSDVLATIAVHIRRLGWTREQVVQQLWQQFGKSHQSRLSYEELDKWLQWLQAYKFPTDAD